MVRWPLEVPRKIMTGARKIRLAYICFSKGGVANWRSPSITRNMKKSLIFGGCILLLFLLPGGLSAQQASKDPLGRKKFGLDGRWQIIIDPFNAGAGNWKPVWKDQKPVAASDFYEYGFTDQLTLEVPGDWNHQRKELTYYEGTIWYKKTFPYRISKQKRAFLHFGAVSYTCDVYLNGHWLGGHEGGFTPFQFEITDSVRVNNEIIVRVNNQRKPENIPAMNFDWWNYGGITREVSVIETPRTYIAGFSIGLSKGDSHPIAGWVQLAGDHPDQEIRLDIPELGIHQALHPDFSGKAAFSVESQPLRWEPGRPKLYSVKIYAGGDSLQDRIGFRTIAVQGTEILLNGHALFLKGINIHEEIPRQRRRAWSAEDARDLLGRARDLGCNFVRLTHYPHSEYMVRLADQMGILLWEEIPLWQGIQFSNPAILNKADTMLREMISRDRNRCSIIIWSLSNETSPSPARNRTLAAMADFVRNQDSSRLIASAINDVRAQSNQMTIDDSLCAVLDLVGVNEYLGWYVPWPAPPSEMVWSNPYNKPLIMSEFGAEAQYGRHGSPDSNGYWVEERQARVLEDQISMFRHIPFLRGTCPWVMADFRSETRMQPVYQQGWNRKGLLSDQGQKKLGWFVIERYYREK
jgi:beta-glucuronidase